MIRQVIKGTLVATGEEVEYVNLIPETDEDHRELDRLYAAGLLETRASFAEFNEDMVKAGLTPPNVDNVKD